MDHLAHLVLQVHRVQQVNLVLLVPEAKMVAQVHLGNQGLQVNVVSKVYQD